MSNFITSRRKFLKNSAIATAALSGAGVVAANTFAPTSSHAQRHQPAPLNIPPLDMGTETSGVRVFDLTMQNDTTEFFEGKSTKTSGVNGSYLGPTLKVRNGKDVRFNVTNNIGEISTLHWHGVHLPASQDGGPHQLIRPGKTWVSQFKVNQKAASLWYHPHLEGKTGEHVWRGIAGMLIVEDDEADALDLPSNYGVDDIPLVLQDRNFSGNGSMDYNPSMHFVMMGLTGDTPLANGTISAYFEATTKLLRLRILNGSNASFYNLGFSDNKPFKQIASDGGLLEAPVELTRLILASGERAEIIVEMSDGETATLKNFTWGPPQSGGGMMDNRGMMGGMMANSGATPEFDFLKITTPNPLENSAKLPSSLIKPDTLLEENATVTRTFNLQMNMGPMVMVGLKNSHLINDKVMKMSRIDETVKMDATEIWEISNSSFMAHPFHIHDVQFQILDRGGKKPAPGERGRKDTVLVNPGETVRLIMKFEDYADPDSPFMYHCHILEHEDAGMMGQFVVV